MKFNWEFDAKAKKLFDKLDKPIKLRIVKWHNTNIKDCENPRLFGQALEGEFENYWRYRVGKYRILADIQDGVFTVLVIKVDKRSDVYKRK